MRTLLELDPNGVKENERASKIRIKGRKKIKMHRKSTGTNGHFNSKFHRTKAEKVWNKFIFLFFSSFVQLVVVQEK